MDIQMAVEINPLNLHVRPVDLIFLDLRNHCLRPTRRGTTRNVRNDYVRLPRGIIVITHREAAILNAKTRKIDDLRRGLGRTFWRGSDGLRKQAIVPHRIACKFYKADDRMLQDHFSNSKFVRSQPSKERISGDDMIGMNEGYRVIVR